MGITRFIPWLLNRYKITYYNRVASSSLLLDMNGEIWKAAAVVYGNTEDDKFNEQRRKAIELMNLKTRTAELEIQHINLVINKIFKHIGFWDPKYFVILAIDGVAPDAKINQQRQRRYRAAAESHFRGYFNSNSISPGTPFMMRLNEAITEKLEQIALDGTRTPPTIIYSSHMTPGEGEHKILDFLRDPDLKLVNSETNKGGNIMYGLDADLVLLSLISPIRNIFLYREQEHRGGTQVIMIERLKDKLRTEFPRARKSVLHDFVLISFLVGNDFLPHQPSMATINQAMDRMLKIYAHHNGVKDIKRGINTGKPLPLTDGRGNINWPNFTFFVNTLSKKEPGGLVNEFGMVKKFPSPLLQASVVWNETMGRNVIDMAKFSSLWYQNMGIQNPEDIAFLKKLGISAENHVDVTEICLQYLKTISWNLQYYLKGFGKINARWYYPHHHTPLLGDLSKIMRKLLLGKQASDYISDLNNGVLNKPPGKIGHTDPLNVVHQLLAIMPPTSINLLPPEAQPLMSPSSILGDMFPIRFVIERYDVAEDWMGEVLIPFANADRIRMAVENTVEFTDQAISKFNSVPAKRYVYRDIVIAPKDPGPKKIDKTRKTKTGVLPRSERIKLWKQNKLPL